MLWGARIGGWVVHSFAAQRPADAGGLHPVADWGFLTQGSVARRISI